MEYVFYGLLAVAFIAFVVLVIRSYRKKLLLLTEWSVKTVPQE